MWVQDLKYPKSDVPKCSGILAYVEAGQAVKGGGSDLLPTIAIAVTAYSLARALLTAVNAWEPTCHLAMHSHSMLFVV